MITDNYIKMCEKAEEIQKLWKPDDGDYFYGYEWGDLTKIPNEEMKLSELASKEVHVCYYSGDDFESCFPIENDDNDKPDLTKSIWMPTQEQLQEMIKNRWFHIWGYDNFTNLYMTASTGIKDSHYVCENVTSMNELWLAFVMFEKYQKRWDGNNWIDYKI